MLIALRNVMLTQLSIVKYQFWKILALDLYILMIRLFFKLLEKILFNLKIILILKLKSIYR